MAWNSRIDGKKTQFEPGRVRPNDGGSRVDIVSGDDVICLLFILCQKSRWALQYIILISWTFWKLINIYFFLSSINCQHSISESNKGCHISSSVFLHSLMNDLPPFIWWTQVATSGSAH